MKETGTRPDNEFPVTPHSANSVIDKCVDIICSYRHRYIYGELICVSVEDFWLMIQGETF